MSTTTSIAIAGTICLAFGAAAIAGDPPAVRSASAQAEDPAAIRKCGDKSVADGKSCEKKAEAAPGPATAGVPEQRKTSNAYRNAKARLAIARDRARQQLAEARKDEAARRPP